MHGEAHTPPPSITPLLPQHLHQRFQELALQMALIVQAE